MTEQRSILCVCVCQVARKLLMVEGELERVEDRAEQAERFINTTQHNGKGMSNTCL